MTIMKTEYLISIENKENICKDEQSFSNLLMINSDIKVDQNIIKYQDTSYTYENKRYPSKKSDYTYFHLTIGAEITNPRGRGGLVEKDQLTSDQQVELYEQFRREIRTIIRKIACKFQIIWDDVSFYYSKLTYPKIYEMENSMRKLITKFMVINVGINWEEENTPQKLLEYAKKQKDDDLLYKLNFSHISNYLFDEFSKNDVDQFVKQNKNKNSFTFDELEPFLKMSNWDRIFNKYVDLKGSDFKKEWSNLYKYRCKIAHNKLFTRTDYNEVMRIVDEIKPQIDKAIANLDNVDLSEEESEMFGESFVVMDNDDIKEFIDEYNTLSKFIDFLFKRHEPRARNYVAHYPEDGTKFVNTRYKVEVLYDKSVINRNEFNIIISILRFKDILVRYYASMDSEDVRQYIKLAKRTNGKLEMMVKSDIANVSYIARDLVDEERCEMSDAEDDCEIDGGDE